MIGLSLSFCVRDIANGKVKLEDVEKIITGARYTTIREFEDILNQYLVIPWNNDPRCIEVVCKLQFNNKIHQPRLDKSNPRVPNLRNGHWVKTESEINWIGY